MVIFDCISSSESDDKHHYSNQIQRNLTSLRKMRKEVIQSVSFVYAYKQGYGQEMTKNETRKLKGNENMGSQLRLFIVAWKSCSEYMN